MTGTILIDSDGAVVGQVNGLSVYNLGDYMFGKPSRITVKTSMGKAGIINIEREVEMSGPIHNKGVYILAGYLRGQYAQDKPITMSASICFEQSYGGVDGDSASSTEIYGLLSSLSGLPLRQDHCGDRFGESEGRDSADRRRQRKDRGVLRCLQEQKGSPESRGS